ncbi:MAG: CAP domain-containing protein, partial [Clostridium sp.]|nr:CAP domain-containing protein [Clostridium sp.]
KVVDVSIIEDTPVVKKYKVNSAEYKKIMNTEMYRLIAELREEKGRPVVGIDSNLQELARLKNEHMITYKYFDHAYEDKMIGQLYPDLIPNHDEGDDWRSCLENIYLGGDSLEDQTEEEIKETALSIFNLWKGSVLHYSAMVNEDVTLIGFDYTISEYGTGYATLEAYVY